MTTTYHFEQGPIRPPNEARSLLLRLTRNCPWNRCLFCPVYKKRKFSLRPIDDIKQDIRTVRGILDDITVRSTALGHAGAVTDAVISDIYNDPATSDVYRSVAAWRYFGTGACFLQDADNLVMKTEDLVAVLQYLRETLPLIQRVTTYARSRTIVRKSDAALTRFHQAGLDRIHIGLESGCDAVLKRVQKGVSAEQHIQAGLKVKAAGMQLSEYIMPGLGGQDMCRDHTRETARVLNAINPHSIRLRSLRVPDRAPLSDLVKKGEFIPQTDDMLAEELHLLITSLEGITSMVASDHIMNLFETLGGRLPDDKAAMLNVIETYQQLSDHDRLIYRIGRRGGTYRSPEDLKADSATYHKIKNLVTEITLKEGPSGLDPFIAQMADRYI